MLVKIDKGMTKICIVPQTHRDTMTLSEILYRLGYGRYEFEFIHPRVGHPNDSPRIELTLIKEQDDEPKTPANKLDAAGGE